MPYFLDSTVILGYVFDWGDHWGKAATKIVQDQQPNHTSTTVIQECFGLENGGRYNTVKETILKEFRRAIAFLFRNNSVTNLRVYAKTKGWRISGIIDQIINASPNNLNQLINNLRVFGIQYEKLCNQRSKLIQSQDLVSIH